MNILFSDRYEVAEQTTKKPNSQNDFYNEFGSGGDQTGPGSGANVKYVNFFHSA